jgi:hypothetical protein
MTIQDLADLGHRMRDAQRAYFSWREQKDLLKSKELEKEFDAAVSRILRGERPMFP